MKMTKLFTYKEVLDFIEDKYIYYLHPFHYKSDVGRLTLGILTTSLVLSYTPTSNEEEVFYNICNKYYRSYCIEGEELTIDNVKEFFIKMLNIFNQSKEKYELLTTLYASQKTHLLDAVKSTTHSTNRFNDTPQDSGLYDDDEHTSNISINDGVAETEVNTPIERLSEVSRKYEDILDKWLKEFAIIFIED